MSRWRAVKTCWSGASPWRVLAPLGLSRWFWFKRCIHYAVAGADRDGF